MCDLPRHFSIYVLPPFRGGERQEFFSGSLSEPPKFGGSAEARQYCPELYVVLTLPANSLNFQLCVELGKCTVLLTHEIFEQFCAKKPVETTVSRDLWGLDLNCQWPLQDTVTIWGKFCYMKFNFFKSYFSFSIYPSLISSLGSHSHVLKIWIEIPQ